MYLRRNYNLVIYCKCSKCFNLIEGLHRLVEKLLYKNIYNTCHWHNLENSSYFLLSAISGYRALYYSSIFLYFVPRYVSSDLLFYSGHPLISIVAVQRLIFFHGLCQVISHLYSSGLETWSTQFHFKNAIILAMSSILVLFLIHK